MARSSSNSSSATPATAQTSTQGRIRGSIPGKGLRVKKGMTRPPITTMTRIINPSPSFIPRPPLASSPSACRCISRFARVSSARIRRNTMFLNFLARIKGPESASINAGRNAKSMVAINTGGSPRGRVQAKRPSSQTITSNIRGVPLGVSIEVQLRTAASKKPAITAVA